MRLSISQKVINYSKDTLAFLTECGLSVLSRGLKAKGEFRKYHLIFILYQYFELNAFYAFCKFLNVYFYTKYKVEILSYLGKH